MSDSAENRFNIGASHTIGSHLLPGSPIDTIHQKVDQKIKLTLAPCNEIVKALKEKKLDLGFIESPLFDEELTHVSWLEDEMVLCSKKQLPPMLYKKDLNHCRIVCDEKGSEERAFIEDFLEKQLLSLDDFDAISEVNNPTAIIQSIKWSKPHAPITAVAIVSKMAIEYELKYNELYASSINNQTIIKKFYIIYREDSEHIKVINEIVKELLQSELDKVS